MCLYWQDWKGLLVGLANPEGLPNRIMVGFAGVISLPDGASKTWGWLSREVQRGRGPELENLWRRLSLVCCSWRGGGAGKGSEFGSNLICVSIFALFVLFVSLLHRRLPLFQSCSGVFSPYYHSSISYSMALNRPGRAVTPPSDPDVPLPHTPDRAPSPLPTTPSPYTQWPWRCWRQTIYRRNKSNGRMIELDSGMKN